MKPRVLLFRSLLLLCCCVAVRAHAQSVGGSCSNTGWISLAQTNPGELLYCNGSTYGLGFAVTSSGLIGIGTATPNSGAILDLGSANTNSLLLPSGTSAQRPTGANGMIRFNSTVPQVEAYYNSAWNALGAGGSSTITLGTAATATNPQRSGQVGTGLFSATSNTVSVAENSTDVADFASTGLNLPGTGFSYELNGNNAVWEDAHNNTALGSTSFTTNVSQSGGGSNGTSNTAVGSSALNSDTTGYSNTAVGYLALQHTTTGYQNTAVGLTALNTN